MCLYVGGIKVAFVIVVTMLGCGYPSGAGPFYSGGSFYRGLGSYGEMGMQEGE